MELGLREYVARWRFLHHQGANYAHVRCHADRLCFPNSAILHTLVNAALKVVKVREMGLHLDEIDAVAAFENDVHFIT